MRISLLIVLTIALVLAAPSTLGAQSATTKPPLQPGGAQPPDGVYTCAWIADHAVEAAAARVSCDPTPPKRFNFGFAPDASGCQYLPGPNTKVGQGVFTWSTFEYANYWDINSIFAADYTWYVQKTDGTNVYSHPWTDTTVHSTRPAANTYRSGAQNHSVTPDRYYTCYNVV